MLLVSVRRKLIWLVEFLKMFYGGKELYRHPRGGHGERNRPAEMVGKLR
jgi:hypothetical protein